MKGINTSQTLGVNFINISFETFLYKSALPSFSLITVGFGIFWQKRMKIDAKAASKMLMKLTIG